MLQFAQATTQPIANEPERIGMSQMTKQHRNELAPTGKASRMSFRLGLFDQSAEFCAGEVMKKLIEQTGGLYHVHALLFSACFAFACHGSDAIQHIIGGHFSFSGPSWKPN
jgi:hypothetical protein